jgi:hypothetical protein
VISWNAKKKEEVGSPWKPKGNPQEVAWKDILSLA